MNEIRVGAAKRCVSPTQQMLPITGYQGVQIEEVLMDLYARAVWLENGAAKFLFLAFECAPGPDREFKEDLSKRYDIPVQNILGVTTHNHSAGIKYSRDPANALGCEYRELLYRRVYEAVDEAIAGQQPATYGFGEGESFINVNRDGLFEDGHWMQTQNFAGPSDKTLSVLRFNDLSGRLIAAVLVYPCHATVAFCVPDADGKVKITGGFPGYTCDYVEQRYGGDAVVLWMSGAAGDQNPIHCSEGFPRIYEVDGYSESIPTPPGTQYVMQRHIGWTHAIDAIAVLNAITEQKRRMRITTEEAVLQMPGQRPPEGADRRLAWLITDNFVRRYRPELLVDGKQPSKDSRYKMEPHGHTHMPMQLALLGDTAWVGAAGELYCEIGVQCKAASPFRHTVIVTHTQGDARDNGGYILSDHAADHDVFQAYSTDTLPGGNDEKIVGMELQMFDAALNK